MPLYSVENLVLLTYAHFLIFLVPAMGLGIALLRENFLRGQNRRKSATLHKLDQREQYRKAA